MACCRVVVHIDLDAFFAAVEVLQNPGLAGKPVVVAGRPQDRGVVASASYPARAFGVCSAMPTARAVVLCPGLIVIPPRHRLYHEYSERVMEILNQSAPVVEQVSIDEAFLELTDRRPSWDAAVASASQLQTRVRVELGLSASVGVATNKLVAKVASDRNKPGGLTVVPAGEEATFLAPLPVRVLWGVGPVTERKLAKMGVTKVGDLARVPERTLREQFGRHGADMAQQCRGIDNRVLVTERRQKSVSQERTFARDLVEAEVLGQHLWQLSQQVSHQLRRGQMAAGTVALKLRYADFTTLTRQTTLAVPTDDADEIYRAASMLLDRAWRQRPVRLLGVAGRHLVAPVGQLSLLPETRNSSHS